MLVAANYHYIRNDFTSPYQGIFGITPLQFESQLMRLSKLAKFVSIDDIFDNLAEKKILAGRNILITFDDGLQEQYELALPILDKLGIPAVFYINTHYLESREISPVHKITPLFNPILEFEPLKEPIATEAPV